MRVMNAERREGEETEGRKSFGGPDKEERHKTENTASAAAFNLTLGLIQCQSG